MATEKENELRSASREGKVDIVNKLLDEGVAQTADEVQDFLKKMSKLSLSLSPSLPHFLYINHLCVSQTSYYLRPRITVRFIHKAAFFPSLC